MAVRRGTATPSAVFRGTVPVQKIMRGTVEVWSSSPYPLTGTFNIVNGAAFQQYEVFSHTVVEPGNFTGTIVIESGQALGYNWTVNGGSQTGGTARTRTFTGLSVGDTIKVTAANTGTLNLSGTWSVVKN